ADEDRAWLEEHVRECAACATRRLLLEATRDAVRETVTARAASADLSRVADAVLARVKEDRPPANVVRLQVWGTEMWRAHRGAISAAAGLAAAACVAALALLVPLRGEPSRPTLLADARPLTTLQQIAKNLSEFSKDFRYRNFQLVSEQSFDLPFSSAGQVELPGSRSLQVTPRQMDPDGRIKVHLELLGEHPAHTRKLHTDYTIE